MAAGQTPEVLIRALAPRYGIDPAAAIAVARGEGGLVNRDDDVGDLAGGGSYGPFQLYTKGELPKQYHGNPQAADSWAWSPDGISYALNRMSQTGARGLSGSQAVETIIRKFERPADPDSSVRNAISRLGSSPAGQSQMAAQYGGQAPQPAGSQSARSVAPTDPRTRLASMLLSRSMERRGANSGMLAQLLERRMQGSGGGGAAAVPTVPTAAAPPAAAHPSVTAGGGAYPYNPLRGAYSALGAPGQGTHSAGEGPDNWQSDNAWDYGAKPGTPVYATDAGVVDPNRYGAMNDSGRFGGYRLNIDGTDSDQFYQHLAENLAVKPGQRVSVGDLLGYIGAVPGLAPHLHYGRSR